ncbi:MAG: SRPBCC domain-containing protein [Candidatus Binataceae bacterium]
MTRIFDAPLELVFNAWTERERLMQWWGPKGLHDAYVQYRPQSGRRLSLRLSRA